MKSYQKILSTIAILSLSACVSAQQREAMEQEKSESYALAKKLYSKKYQDECLAIVKKGMHDPNSLQISGKAIIYSGAPDYIWDWKKLVSVSIPARGKNAFGALVKNDITCLYKVDLENKSMYLSDIL